MNRRKTILAAMVGNALEYYDVTLYGLFTVFLSPVFFPSDNPKNSLMAGFAALATGFFARPIGGLLFGHFGDKIGRRKVLLGTVLLVTIPTVTIGILPTYETIGIVAPIIIVLCRIMQGLCTSAEYGGAVTLIAESSSKNSIGFSCSWLPCSSIIGAALGTILGAVCLMDNMPTWAWRIPFLLAGVFGIIGYFLRSSLQESPSFERISRENKLLKVPILDVLKNKTRNFLCTVSLGAATVAPFYISSVYILSILVSEEVDITSSQAMLCNVGTMLFLASLLPIMGYFSDKVGIKKFMIYASIFNIVCALPIFYLISYDVSVLKILLAQAVISVCAASFVAPYGAYVTSLFPARERYSGVAFGVSLGEAICGGTAPLIATALVVWSGSNISPAFYLIFCSIIGIIAVSFGKQDKLSKPDNDDLIPEVNSTLMTSSL